MAQTNTQFTQPESFSFVPTEWPNWKTRFLHFHTLSKLKEEDEEYQVHALLYALGEKAEEVFSSFGLGTDEAKKFDSVLKKFDDFFVGKKNVVYERAKFGSRSQGEGETIDEFVTALHTLSKHCEYETLRESLVRDRLVLGVRDSKLSEKLMLIEKLTLVKATELSKQWEAVKFQQSDIKKETNVSMITKQKSAGKNKFNSSKFDNKFDKVSTDARMNKSGTDPIKNRYKTTSKEDKSSQIKKCSKCGYNSHFKGVCPAKDVECKSCHKIGHYAKVCRSTTKVSQVKSEVNETCGFIDAIRTQHSDIDRKKWSAFIGVGKAQLEFKLDTGADVTVIPFKEYLKKWNNHKLVSPDLILHGANSDRLSTVGMFGSHLTHGTETMKENIYVVRCLDKALLGRRACEQLKLVQRLDNVKSNLTNVDPKAEFPKLFQGLGVMNMPYTIKLKEGAVPYAIYTPRRIPIALMAQVKEGLDEMVRTGVIETVDEPSEWCAPAVFAPKPNGNLRICCDLTRLNKSVQREFHPMPVIEHELGQLPGARVFSKLDAFSGFYQIVLAEESRHLTTFITPFGRFRYCRVPFGITSGPEVYQKRMTEILCGIKGVIVHCDDCLIWGTTVEEHDERLRQVLLRLSKAGITLNPDKCVFGVDRVTFVGNVIDTDGIRPNPNKIQPILEMPTPKSVSDVRRFLGLVQYLGRFVQGLSDKAQALNELLKKKVKFIWGTSQENSFRAIKEALSQEPVLAVFDVNRETIVSADASSYGLGSVLLQRQDDLKLSPVAYASRTLSVSEKRYAQIEKEALAITWGYEKFRDFVTGMDFQVETDHKIFVPIMTIKNLDDLSPRLLRFRLRMMKFSFSIKYTRGKDLIVADALSRQPLSEKGDDEFEEEVSAFVIGIKS